MYFYQPGFTLFRRFLAWLYNEEPSMPATLDAWQALSQNAQQFWLQAGQL